MLPDGVEPGNSVDEKVVVGMMAKHYGVEHPEELDEAAKQLMAMMSPAQTGTPYTLTGSDLASFLSQRKASLDALFDSLDKDKDGHLEFTDLNCIVDPAKHDVLWCVLDNQSKGYITRDEFKYQLILAPVSTDRDQLFDEAYDFFAEDPQYPGHYGFGYFWAGGLAGVISRTCTAPFDRLKVYLIAQSSQTSISIREAITRIYANGGPRAFFVGNGLNVIKVFPESAMKFGGFEMAKRLFASIEGVEDQADLSRLSTFFAGGLGGMMSQLCVYPIDTLKFRVQCNTLDNKHGQVTSTIRTMWQDGGIRSFYRGLYVGVLGIFPFAALDLGLFSLFKSTYIARKAKLQNVDASEVQMGNMVVLSMGALSGSIGASAVYPINLLRTRIQTQNTRAHPYTYNGFMDCARQTYKREGWKGYFRGLGPNLAKVAPSVSISYLVYENAKHLMGLA